jgi:hypothetical protein
LFFGRTSVSDTDWQNFVDTDITDSFPDGFTILNADGAWRAPGAARSMHEPSNVLLIAAPRAPAALTRVHHLIEIYKQRFHQQSVGLTVQQVCAAFQ